MFKGRFDPLAWCVVPGLLAMLGAFGGQSLAGPYCEADEDGISYDDSGIVAWATGCTGWRSAQATYGTWDDAIGPAPGTLNDVVSFSDGGYAELTFGVTIADGPGADLAVFENAFFVGATTNIFAELAFVEVSSDGVSFARFPSHSLTTDPKGPFDPLDPTDVHNLAGKHVNSTHAVYGDLWLGTPFDLIDLINEDEVQSGLVSLSNINYVRIVDIIGGDDTARDAQGNVIYDPYPTDDPVWGTGGFDLDAVAVLNIAGDVDGDGFVGGADLNTIITNWGLTGATRQQGDLNGDGNVGGSDYNAVLTNWGAGNPPEPTSIPEPSALVSLLLAGFVYVSGRARKRSI